MSAEQFDYDVRTEVAHNTEDGGPIVSASSLCTLLSLQVSAMEELVMAEPADWTHFRRHLITIAATCRRAARDLKIETAGDAFDRDCPF